MEGDKKRTMADVALDLDLIMHDFLHWGVAVASAASANGNPLRRELKEQYEDYARRWLALRHERECI